MTMPGPTPLRSLRLPRQPLCAAWRAPLVAWLLLCCAAAPLPAKTGADDLPVGEKIRLAYDPDALVAMAD